ncbi:LPS assembly lipoprotein LptE [Roseibium litorale]|uniref:LPS-assembly lipoprotein n=1 Tax=Roseibium litorale TaxID=2803841 RepID=A0ABR9CLU7_9HYPH|nr:LPS assembly lipoprotein LptE [Roseibium litorale]MBD8891639.1 hypothetical protein [Roseibium litorale]
MSLLDVKNRSFRGFFSLACATVLLASLSACQVRPLYGSLSEGPGSVSSTVQAELAAIDIDPIRQTQNLDDASRTLYNELLFNFERGAGHPEKKYRLKVVMSINTAEVGVIELADVPTSYTLTMNTTFVLSDVVDGKTVMTGRSFATASYDFSSQRYANIRAKRDAADRAAKVVADDIQMRIAGFFASHR